MSRTSHLPEGADVVIVGAGPAGLATSIRARQAGLSVVVVDSRRPPLDQACGEGLMPGGARELQLLGVRLPDDGRRRFVGIRYLDGELVAEGRFPDGAGAGLGSKGAAHAVPVSACAVTIGSNRGRIT